MKTRKQLLQELSSQMPENLSILEKAAYIANFVASQTKFDEHFLWGNKKERTNAYNNARRESSEATGDTPVRRKIICITETSLFAYLARNFGIKVGYLVTNDEGTIFSSNTMYLNRKSIQHVAPAIKIEDGRWIKIDIQKDLHNWKTGCKPEFFGTKEKDEDSISELSLGEIEDTLYNIGYPESGEYTDYIINGCMKDNVNKKIEELFEDILKNEKIAETFGNLGTVEAYNYIKKFLKKISSGKNDKQSKSLNIFVCYVKSPEHKREYNFGVFPNDSAFKWIYMFSKKQKKMIRVSIEEMQYMLKRNLKLKEKAFNERIFKEFLKNNQPKTSTDEIRDLTDDLMYDDEEK